MKHGEEDVIAALEGQGLPWQSYFVLNKATVAFRDEQGQVILLIIEDDELKIAACKFLKKQGLILNEDNI